MNLFKSFKQVLFALMLLQASLAFSQSVTIVSREPALEIVFDDTLAAALTKAMTYQGRMWHNVKGYQYFTTSFEIDTTDIASLGLASTDTVEILMAQYYGDDPPSSTSPDYLELSSLARESIAIFDSTKVKDTPTLFVSFHGTGDPEIAPGPFVKFYVRVVGGFISSGIPLKMKLFKQP